MKIFLYEFVTGGGGWTGQALLDSSLLAEARAMVRAVASDFGALDGVEVFAMRDARLGELHPAGCHVTVVKSANDERAAMRRLAASCDQTLVVAPETGGALLERSRLVEEVGGRLLSPSPACIEIAASKQATAEVLGRRGVRVPTGALISAGDGLPRELNGPVVVKPDDGCGSQEIQLLREGGRESFPWNDGPSGQPRHGKDSRPLFRVEQFVPGLPASVAVLCGPGDNHALPACRQRLSTDGRFAYCGGRLPLESSLDRRARELARAAIAALPEPRGYLGVDLVLGEADDGCGDCVIEINPRLTTSYVGLRALARTNLAAAMLAVVSGHSPDLCFDDKQLEFTANGQVL
jgi:predicted ATP-grasp superfamily ATP-dependent carboligase